MVNIPNLLSLLRLILVPMFCVAFFSGGEHAHMIAGLIFLAASATDMLDGYLARRLNQITRLGRILDPLADKLMTATALISLFVAGMIPLWIGAVFVIKEIFMLIGGIRLYRRMSDMPPSNIVDIAAEIKSPVRAIQTRFFRKPVNRA